MSTPKLASIATILLTLSAACGDADEPTPALGTGTSTDGGFDEAGTDTGSEGAPLPDLPEEDTPPELISLLVNGSEAPPTLFAAAYVEAVATVTDDHGVDHVDFYVDQEKVASDDEAPFTARFPFRSSTENGSRVIRAAVWDSSGQSADKKANLEVDLPKRGTIMWAKDDVPGLPDWTSIISSEDERSLTAFGEGHAARFSADGQLVDSWDLPAFETVALNTVLAAPRPDGGFLALAAPEAEGYLLLQALDANLQVLWGKPYTSVPNPSDIELRSFEIVDGHALFAGARRPANAAKTCPWIVRSEPLSAGAHIDWQKSLDCSGDFSNESIAAMGISPQGTIYAIHDQSPSPVELIAMSQAGVLLWTKALEETTRVNSLVVDADGGVHLAGHSLIDNSPHGYLASYTPEGELRWDWTVENDELAEAVSIDSFDVVGFDAVANRIIGVAADKNWNNEISAVVIERSPLGILGWEHGLHQGVGSYFRPADMIIDSLGYIYLAGQSPDIQVMKLHP